MKRALLLLLFATGCSRASSMPPMTDADNAAITARLAAAPRPPATGASPLGTNLAPIADWSTERPFADLMKQSRTWISNAETTWDDGRPLDVDAHGDVRSLKPGQRARTLVMWGEPIPAGDYVLTWSGSGTLDTWPQPSTADGERKLVIHADPAKGGIAVTITATDAKNPIRELHVRAAGTDEKAEFAPKFLEGLKGYSTLRFMDWMLTNDARAVHFAERSVPGDVRWSDKGVPLEVMVDLCNAAHADMWLSIPDTWDDDAVAQAAVLVHGRLDKALVLYVEHSNEVWNDMFPQAKRSKQEGLARGLAKDPFEAQLRRHAQRSVEIFQAFEKPFAKDPQRLVRTMAGMAVNSWSSEVMMTTPGAAAHTDALAVAPYIGVSVSTVTSPQAAVDALEHDIAAMTDLVKKQQQVAARFKVKLVAYEGGQHLSAHGNDALAPALMAANKDPRLKGIYLRMLGAWKEAGGGLFVHYFDVGAYNKFGAWGARETPEQSRAQAPKYDALMTFVEQTPRWF